MAWAHVQPSATSNTPTIGTVTQAATLGSAVSNQSIVIGCVTFDRTTGQTLSSVNDDKGNTYATVSVSDTTNNQTLAYFVRGNITNGPITVTAHFSGNTQTITMVVDEYSGGALLTDPRDGSVGNFQPTPGTGANLVVSTNITPANNGCLIWGCSAETGVVAGSLAAGSGYTIRGQVAGVANIVAVTTEDQVQAVAAAIQTTFTEAQASATVTFAVGLQPATGAVSQILSASQAANPIIRRSMRMIGT